MSQPTGKQLEPKLVSIAEILGVLALIIFGGVTVGYVCYYKLSQTYDWSTRWTAITMLGMLILWLLLRAFLVRAGLAHPAQVMPDKEQPSPDRH